MPARALIGRQRRLLALVWAVCLLPFARALPLAVLCASALVLAGRLLGAADPASSERCRRAMVAVGELAMAALALCLPARALELP